MIKGDGKETSEKRKFCLAASMREPHLLFSLFYPDTRERGTSRHMGGMGNIFMAP